MAVFTTDGKPCEHVGLDIKIRCYGTSGTGYLVDNTNLRGVLVKCITCGTSWLLGEPLVPVEFVPMRLAVLLRTLMVPENVEDPVTS